MQPPLLKKGGRLRDSTNEKSEVKKEMIKGFALNIKNIELYNNLIMKRNKF